MYAVLIKRGLKMASKTSLRTSLNNVFYSGVATSAMDTLATGPFLIAYALMFGAGNIAIGFLGSIAFIGNLTHLLSAYLIEQDKTPKNISLFFITLSRPFYLIAAALAFFAGQTWALYALLVCFAATYMIGSVGGGAWLPWMKALVPPKIMGRFFAHRFKYMMIAKMFFYGLGAGVIYLFEKELPAHVIYAYSILLLISFFIGIYSVITLNRVQNMPVAYQKTNSFGKKALQTFKNEGFRRLLVFLGILNFALNFVTPFFIVFMLKALNIPMPFVIILTLISQTTHAFTVKYWGKLADKKNCENILYKSIPVFMGCILLFGICSYLPNGAVILGLLGLIHILLGIGQSAITLGMNNISLLHFPKEDASIYLSVNSVFKASTSAIGSIIAGISLNGFDAFGGYISKTTALNGAPLSWSLFFLTGILLCALSFPFLNRVQKCSNK